MLLLFPSWVFVSVGLLFVGIICGIISLLTSRWMQKKSINDKRMENIAAFLIVIVVFAAAMFMKENVFTSVYEGSLIVTKDEVVEVNYSSAELLIFNDFLIIDYLFTQLDYGEEFALNNQADESVRVTVAFKDYHPLLFYKDKYDQEGIDESLNTHFPFDVYFKREHYDKIKDIIAESDSMQTCENLLPHLEERLASIEEDFYHYEIACIR